MTTFETIVAVLAGWNEGVSLAPQVISGLRLFFKVVNP
jgi:hypothetical protein